MASRNPSLSVPSAPLPPQHQTLPIEARKPLELFQSTLKNLTVIPIVQVDDQKRKAVERQFVLTRQLEKSLHEKVPSGDYCFAEELLDYVYRKEDPIPIKIERVLAGHKRSCLLTFCILLELGQGHLLHQLVRHDICDKTLPLDLKALRRAIEKFRVAGSPDLAEEFDKKQWKYFPVFLEPDLSGSWHSQKILPFCDRELINDKGSTAEIHQIAVPEEYVDEQLGKFAIKFQHPEFPEQIGPCYHFALKVFKDGNKQLFNDELKAYRKLNENRHGEHAHKGMVRFLGEFSYVDSTTQAAEHNILLEYGDNDLAEYFYRTPPVLTKAILKFWADLSHVLVAIRGLHVFETTRLNQPTKYQGWHADIKPDNILLVRGEFKLADPGFARFKKQQKDQSTGKDLTVLFGGTTTYGAPECYFPNAETPHPRSIDMWSFGCVLSEAATWMALGRSGVLQYSVLRENAISALIGQGSSHLAQKKTKDRGLMKGDYFHDGKNPLQEVHEWHKYLRMMLRPTDLITAQILKLIDDGLLVGDPQKRLSAETLCEEFEKLLESSRLVSVDPLHNSVEAAIKIAMTKEVDDLQNWTRIQDSGSVKSRKAYKSSNIFLQVPGDPSSIRDSRRRSSLLADISLPPDPGTPPLSQRRSNGNQYGSARRVERESSGSMSTISPTTFSRVGTTSTFSNHNESQKRLNVFDAFYMQNNAFKEHKRFHFAGLKYGHKTDTRLSREIKDRDLLFLVDNARSMEEHWSEVCFVLDRLVTISRNLDKDGMELRFTACDIKIDNVKGKEPEKFQEVMLSRKARPEPLVDTDMAAVLGRILSDWIAEFKQSHKTKDLTIIVLTDGKWEGMRLKPLAVDNKIVEFNETYSRIAGSNLRERAVSIQFVSFGQDEDALYRLMRLDDDLKFRGVPDIVDTEPSTGDIYKMLLGSINENMDRQNDPPKDPNGQADDGPTDAFDEANYRISMQNRNSAFNVLHSPHGTILPSRPQLGSPANSDADFVFKESLHS